MLSHKLLDSRSKLLKVTQKLLKVTLSRSKLLLVTREMDTTIATMIMERIANMSDELDTIKEVEAYFKQAMKEIKEEKKKLKAEEAAKKKNGKKNKRDDQDEDGNEKPKKPATPYQIFAKEIRAKIKEDFPELSPADVRTKLSEEWKKHKEELAAAAAMAVSSATPESEN